MAEEKYGFTIADTLEAYLKRLDDDPAMLDENKKKNKTDIVNFVKKTIVEEFGFNYDQDLSELNNSKVMEGIVEKLKKTKKSERAKGDVGVTLKAFINRGLFDYNVEATNQVVRMEEMNRTTPTNGFNIAATRKKAKREYPSPWEFHKAINDGFSRLPDQNTKAFAMTKLFSGIRNKDILRLEVLPDDPKDMKKDATYVDLKKKQVRIYNKGQPTTLKLGSVITQILIDTAEEAKESNRAKLFPEKETTYRNLINTSVREVMDERGLFIRNTETFDVIPFSLKDLRSNIFDILEDEYGAGAANQVLGHSTKGDVGMDHYKAARTERRSSLMKMTTVDHFAKMFFEDILYTEDALGQISLPEDRGLSPQAFLESHGFTNAAKRIAKITPVAGNAVDRAVQGVQHITAMSQNQVEQQINNFITNVTDLSKKLGKELSTVGGQLTKLMEQVGQLKTAKEEAAGVSSKTLDEMSNAEREQFLTDNKRPGESDALTEYRMRERQGLDISPEFKQSVMEELDKQTDTFKQKMKDKFSGMITRDSLKRGVQGLAVGAATLLGPAGKLKAAEIGSEIAIEAFTPSVAGDKIQDDPGSFEDEQLLQKMQSGARTADLTPVSDIAAREARTRLDTLLPKAEKADQKGRARRARIMARDRARKLETGLQNRATDLEEEYQGFALKRNEIADEGEGLRIRITPGPNPGSAL
jgi:hypothetical protein